MPDVGHMYPDLMGPTRFKTALEVRGPAPECFNNLGSCYSVASALKQNGLLLTVGLVPGELRRDANNAAAFEADAFHAAKPRVGKAGHAIANGVVAPLDAMGGELLGQSVMSFVRFGDDKESGRILVDSVHDARALFATDAGQAIAEMMEKSIHERPPRRSGGRMHHHACGLVDNNQVVIFKDHIERDRLRPRLDLYSFFNRNLKFIAGSDLPLWIADHHAALRDRPLRH